jgi:pimeloyl-ACP methyl ester carboxylesterase
MTNTHLLDTADVDIAYDIRGPLTTADGRPPLFMIGQPMDASGLATLASYFPDRTVVTYDPRGLGRSIRKDDQVDNVPEIQAGDVTTLVAHEPPLIPVLPDAAAAQHARDGFRDV